MKRVTEYKHRYGVRRNSLDGAWLIFDKVEDRTVSYAFNRDKARKMAREMNAAAKLEQHAA